MNDEMRAVIAVLRGKRLPLENEKALQEAMLEAFRAAWCADHFRTGREFWSPSVEREARLDSGVIDFLVGGHRGCAVEVKIKGQAEAIRRQLRRYAADERVTGVLLVTSRPVGVVSLMNGKPVAEFDLSRAWL